MEQISSAYGVSVGQGDEKEKVCQADGPVYYRSNGGHWCDDSSSRLAPPTSLQSTMVCTMNINFREIINVCSMACSQDQAVNLERDQPLTQVHNCYHNIKFVYH